MSKVAVIIPTPCVEEVEKWLKVWSSVPDYTEEEKALDKLFFGEFKSNNSLQNVLIKCSVLNDFYSTNIFKVYPVAVHIHNINIDERLYDSDPTLVDDIASISLAGKPKYFYSFASKYCSHHNPLNYPIYDSYVEKVLKYFRNINKELKFLNKDLKNYSSFKNLLLRFQQLYNIEQYNLKELDRYLWQIGKYYFPNNYD